MILIIRVKFFPASIAVLVRQTNVVWVAFIAFLSISHVLKLHVLQYNSRLSPKLLKSTKYLQVSALILQYIFAVVQCPSVTV
jgi:hypothetical protein